MEARGQSCSVWATMWAIRWAPPGDTARLVMAGPSVSVSTCRQPRSAGRGLCAWWPPSRGFSWAVLASAPAGSHAQLGKDGGACCLGMGVTPEKGCHAASQAGPAHAGSGGVLRRFTAASGDP